MKGRNKMKYENTERYDDEQIAIIVSGAKLKTFKFILSENMLNEDLGWFIGESIHGMRTIKVNNRIKVRSLMRETIEHELLHLVFDIANVGGAMMSQETLATLLAPYIEEIHQTACEITDVIFGMEKGSEQNERRGAKTLLYGVSSRA